MPAVLRGVADVVAVTPLSTAGMIALFAYRTSKATHRPVVP